MPSPSVEIILLTGNHLCHNPRVIKESITLARVGYKVEVLGAWTDASLKTRDQKLIDGLPFRYTPVLDVTATGFANKFYKQACRIRGKLGQLIYQKARIQNCWQLGYAIGALGHAAKKRRADLYIAHSEAGMQVAVDLLLSGQQVAVDMEDWFSADLLPEARRQRPVELLRSLEQTLLCRGVYSSCPSHAMGKALANEFGCNEPSVIYNAFPWADREAMDGLSLDRTDRRIPSIHWVSQTVGPGRGLEDLFAALPYIEHDVEIHLRGNPVAHFDDWISSQVPAQWRKQVFVHDLVPNESLLSRIAEHDIGFAGEMAYCRSRELTITNKILHFLLAGLAVVASDTPGQREVADKARGGVLLYPSGVSPALAARLNELLSDPKKLQSCKAAALQAAEKEFCWEKQEPVVLASISRSLGMTQPASIT
jgi:glycosyltransferase involved in cell wall biosynthesis